MRYHIDLIYSGGTEAGVRVDLNSGRENSSRRSAEYQIRKTEVNVTFRADMKKSPCWPVSGSLMTNSIPHMEKRPDKHHQPG